MATTHDSIELTPPGQILMQEFLEPLGVSKYRLAKAMGVPAMRISYIVSSGNISPEMSVLLDKALGMSRGYFMRLQADYERRLAERAMHERLEQVVPLVTAA